MQTDNPQELPNQVPDNIRNLLIYYSDSIVRSLIAIVGVVILLGLISETLGIDMPIYLILATSIIFSIIVSPFLNKIKVAHLWVDKYVAFLNKIIYKLQQRKKGTQ